MKKRLIGLVSGLAVVSTLALTLFFVTNPFVAADAVADIALRPALTVSVTAPRTETLPVRLTANGDIAAWQEAIIGSDVTDLRLAEVRVNVGDAVRKGEVLAVFDDATVKIEVAQAEAALAEAEALVVEAEENARRARSLDKTGALSAQQILQYVTAAETAKAR
ncbi:MAG: biotin/lipoyl-binding protein, partial [Zoogloeaceae bacterium]|nr:biotin/lipoyl-binding protein [Zoogloeaceae bacterium]